jgi:competence ComEA-like helix-hairpin-helix protein
MLRFALPILTLAALIALQPSDLSAQTKPASRTAAKPPAPAGTVNINTASAAELDALPGVGAKTAALIVEYRQKNGPFKKVEEILENPSSDPISLRIFNFGVQRPVSQSL